MNRGMAGATIDGVQPELLRAFPLKATSADRCWEGVHINEFAGFISKICVSPPRDHVKIGLCIGTSPSIRREACGKTFTSPSRIGEFSILPAGRKSRWHGLAPAHLDIRLDPGKMDEMAAELRKAGERRFEFANVPRMRDPDRRAHRRDLQNRAEPRSASRPGHADRVDGGRAVARICCEVTPTRSASRNDRRLRSMLPPSVGRSPTSRTIPIAPSRCENWRRRRD